jgi:hypothetical protein
MSKPVDMPGLRLIAAERARQMAPEPNGEDWKPEHDDQHEKEALAYAAVCYAMPQSCGSARLALWPWDERWWKPAIRLNHIGERKRELAKAGALIAAELDRLIRLEKKHGQE